MKTSLLLLLVFYFGYNVSGQPVIGRQLADQYPISRTAKTFGLTWLPADYHSTNDRYPLIIFLHAGGEGGDGVKGLYNLLNVGLPRKIAEGWDPQAVDPEDGKNYQFIVVSPQAPAKSGWSYSYTHVKNILPDVVSRYRVDTNRIYLMGISAGGGGTWSSVTNDSNFTKKFAAILPVSSTGVNNPSVEFPNIKYISGKYGVKVWAVCGAKDGWYNTSLNYVNMINTAKQSPSVPALLTAVPGYGHDTTLWKTVFDASWRNNSIHLNFYEWMLQYERGNGHQPPPPPNQLPVVDAGSDKAIALPRSAVKLRGSAVDPDGTIASFMWTKISGPSQFTIDSLEEAEILVKDLVEGIYGFELKATDNAGATARDTVMITVSSAHNQLPVVNAGKDQVVILPIDSVSLHGMADNPDGMIINYQWKKIGGPQSFNIVSPDQPETVVSGLQKGTYQFELTATDDSDNTVADTVIVSVITSPSNEPPVAHAGSDLAITLPLNTVSLSGSGSDADGTIISYSWSKVAGPSQFVINNNSIAKPVLSNLIAGNYTFRLTVTDDNKATATDDVNIVVNRLVDGYKPIPGKIQAEDYDAMKGVATEITRDKDGGRDVGWINEDDWMDFDIYADSAGTYTINFRIATPNAGANFQLRDANGTTLATVDVPNTGNYQAWITQSVTVSLRAGYQRLRIISTDKAGWNINWIEFVDGVSTGKKVPAKIEAEAYDSMEGIRMETTGDTGGGLDVGWIDYDDWMDYHINASSAGKYTVTFRVATPNAGAKLQVRDLDGNVLAKVDIPNTGGYQKWVTVSTTLSLAEGQQTLRIVSSAFANWNINWLEFEKSSDLIAQNNENISEAASNKVLTSQKLSSIEISPNPVKDRFALLVNNANTGTVKIQLADMQGIAKKEFHVAKNLSGPQSLNLSLYGLTPGMYIIRVELGTWSDSKFILKQ